MNPPLPGQIQPKKKVNAFSRLLKSASAAAKTAAFSERFPLKK